jgi:hypothetical protein
MLSEYFWTFFTGACLAFVYKVVQMMYRSKCDNIECCGCKIKRNTVMERDVDLDISLSSDVESIVHPL